MSAVEGWLRSLGTWPDDHVHKATGIVWPPSLSLPRRDIAAPSPDEAEDKAFV
jgi:hypothetical protein